MALFRKAPPPPPPPSRPPPGPPPVPETRRFTDPHRPATTIPAGIRIRGELTGGDSVDLAGALEGPLATEGGCHVRESGRLHGPLSAADVRIEGEMEGRIDARGKVELGARSRVRADIHASGIAVAEGCQFDGQVHMDSGQERVTFEEKRKLRPPGP